MKEPTKKIMNLARRYNKVTKDYYDTVAEYVNTCEPMNPAIFWGYLDRLAKNIEERKDYMGNPIKSGIHNTFLEIRNSDETRTPLEKWVRCAYFVAAYNGIVDKLDSKCFDMSGVEKSDDSYGDWVDALPLAGKKVVNALLHNAFGHYDEVFDAVEQDRVLLWKLIMDGENYVRSELQKKLIKNFADAVASEDHTKNSEDMIPTWQ